MNTPEKPPQRPSKPRTPAPASTETPGTESEPHAGVQRIRLFDLARELEALHYRLAAARDAAALHRQGLITSAELYAVIEAPDVPRQPDSLCDRIEAVRALHKPMQRGSGVYCAHCSHWDGRRVLGVLTDYPCDTLRALDGPPQPRTGPTEIR